MAKGKTRKGRSRPRSTNVRRAGAPTRPATRTRRRRRVAIIGTTAAVASVALLIYATMGGTEEGPTTDVAVPELSTVAARGQRAFEANCAVCHGPAAGGTRRGPPLVHRIYEPSHHGDAAFIRAVRFGVRPHHWQFGPMPKVDVSDREVSSIVAFVRELQRANGIR